MFNGLVLAVVGSLDSIIESNLTIRRSYLSQQSRMNEEMFKEHCIEIPSRKCICCGAPGYEVDH